MKFLLFCLLVSLFGIFIFNMASERVWNNSFLSVLGLVIAWAGLITGIWKVYKMVNESSSKKSEIQLK